MWNRYRERGMEDEVNVPERSYTFRNFGRVIVVFSFCLFIFSLLLLFLFFSQRISFILLSFIIPTLIGIAYTSLRLKRVFLMKNLLVAFIWGYGCTFFPFLLLASNLLSIPAKLWFLALFVFIDILLNTIFFDIRDHKGDKMNKILTIPVKLGIEKTKRILQFLLLCEWVMVLIPLFLLQDAQYLNFLPVVIVMAISLLFIDHVEKNRDICGLIVDSEFIPLIFMRW